MAHSSKSIAIYSDIHVGSKLAVCHKDCTISDYKPNKLQLALFDIWQQTIDELVQKPSVLVVNGEPFDGANKKQLGSQSMTTDIGKQMNESERLLKMIPCTNILFTKGSGYHVDSDGTSYEEMFAQRMKARPYKAYGGDGFVDDFAMVEINNKLFNFTHHIGFARWQAYRTTALAREMAALHFQKEKLGNVDVIVRSHVHYWVHVEFVHTHGFTTPAWKYPDRHLYRGGQPPIPDIGCVEVIVESNGKIIIEKHISELSIKPEVAHF